MSVSPPPAASSTTKVSIWLASFGLEVQPIIVGSLLVFRSGAFGSTHCFGSSQARSKRGSVVQDRGAAQLAEVQLVRSWVNVLAVLTHLVASDPRRTSGLA